MPDERPNILWVCTDQQRYDTLGCYGNEFIDTPTIDGLAAEGVRFERCYSQSPICTPSRASFLTGRYPRTTRIRQNGQNMPDDEVLVPRRLTDEGYLCGLSGKLHIAAANSESEDRVPYMERRIDDGYADFHWSHSSRHPSPTNEYLQWLNEQGIDPEEALFSFDPPYEESGYVFGNVTPEHHQTTWCVEKAITFMEEAADTDDPWLYSVNFFDPHTPFDPPAEYIEPYLEDLEEIPLPNYERGELEDKPLYHRIPPGDGFMPADEMDEEEHRILRAAYWAMIDLIDDQVERMLEALECTGQRENTVVVFMSDHGELLGDHGIYLKGPFFYEPSIQVPLIVSWPGRIEGGRTSEALVELSDIAPTLLDAAGVEHPPGMQTKSLWPLLVGETDLDHHREDIYSENYHGQERAWFYNEEGNGALQRTDANSEFIAPFEEPDVLPKYRAQLRDHESRVLPYATMVRTDRYKLVRDHSLGDGELYDLEEDPTETHNRYDDPEYASVKTELLERLADRMAGTIDPLPERTGRW